MTVRPPIPVVRAITRLNVGGPAIQAMTLATALEARGYRTVLVHGSLDRGEGDMRYLLDPSATVVSLPFLRRPVAPLDDLRAFASLVSLLRRTRPAILHTHMAKAGLLARAAAAVCNRLPGQPRIRVVHTYHGHVLEGYFGGVRTRLYLELERALARVTDAIIAISENVRRELQDKYRIGRAAQYRVVPLGFDLDAFAALDADARTEARRQLAIPPDAEVVTTVGRLTAIKDHDLLLDAAQRVIASRPSTIFLIVGDGDRREALEARARALGIADRVRFTGWRRDLTTIYGASDVFTLTSRNEGTPVALIEAMASGVPGVATRVGGVPDVVPDADTGILVPSGDAAALAEAIEDLLGDRSRRQRLGAAARAHVLATFRRDRLVEDIARLYDELLALA